MRLEAACAGLGCLSPCRGVLRRMCILFFFAVRRAKTSHRRVVYLVDCTWMHGSVVVQVFGLPARAAHALVSSLRWVPWLVCWCMAQLVVTVALRLPMHLYKCLWGYSLDSVSVQDVAHCALARECGSTSHVLALPSDVQR